VYLAGHLDLDATERVVRAALDGDPAPGPLRPRPPFAPAKSSLFTAGSDDADNVTLRVHVLLPTASPSDAALADLLTPILHARLDAIRERQGITYTEEVETTAIGGAQVTALGLETDPGDAVSAFRTLAALLDDLATAGPTDDEIERARVIALRRRQVDVSTPSDVIAAIAARDLALGDAAGDLASDYQVLRTLAPAQVRAYAAAHLAQRVTAVIGDDTSLRRFTRAVKP
jgi:predicted Zn-dependent peptidase